MEPVISASIYPIARGVAPLAVAVVSISILGENLSHANQGAVLTYRPRITSLALTQRPTRLIESAALSPRSCDRRIHCGLHDS